MEHNRDGTEMGFPRIRGNFRDEPGRHRRKCRDVNYILIIKLLTGREWLEWKEHDQWQMNQ